MGSRTILIKAYMSRELQDAVHSVRVHLVPLLGDPTEADAIRLLLRKGLAVDPNISLSVIQEPERSDAPRKVGVRVNIDMANSIARTAERFPDVSGTPNQSRAIRWLIWAGFQAFQMELASAGMAHG